MRINLLSVSKLTDRDYKVIFKRDCAYVIDTNSSLVLKANRQNGLLYFKTNEEAKLSVEPSNNIMLWHKRLGHLHENALKRMCKSEIATGVIFNKAENLSIYEPCLRGKIV